MLHVRPIPGLCALLAVLSLGCGDFVTTSREGAEAPGEQAAAERPEGTWTAVS